MLSHDLRDLYVAFSDWINGRTKFTVPEAKAFERRLKHAAAKAVMLEIGVDPQVFDTDVPIETIVPIEDGPPGAQLIAFPRERIVRPAGEGVAR
jgi:hypothetical protein